VIEVLEQMLGANMTPTAKTWLRFLSYLKTNNEDIAPEDFKLLYQRMKEKVAMGAQATSFEQKKLSILVKQTRQAIERANEALQQLLSTSDV
jgi:hypothetical protein